MKNGCDVTQGSFERFEIANRGGKSNQRTKPAAFTRQKIARIQALIDMLKSSHVDDSRRKFSAIPA